MRKKEKRTKNRRGGQKIYYKIGLGIFMGLPQFAYPITFLPCRDLEAVRQFYETILLLPVALEQSRCLLFKIGHDPHYAYWGFCEQEAEQGQKKEQNQEILSPPKKVCLTLVVSTRAEVDRWHHWQNKDGTGTQKYCKGRERCC